MNILFSILAISLIPLIILPQSFADDEFGWYHCVAYDLGDHCYEIYIGSNVVPSPEVAELLSKIQSAGTADMNIGMASLSTESFTYLVNHVYFEVLRIGILMDNIGYDNSHCDRITCTWQYVVELLELSSIEKLSFEEKQYTIGALYAYKFSERYTDLPVEILQEIYDNLPVDESLEGILSLVDPESLRSFLLGLVDNSKTLDDTQALKETLSILSWVNDADIQSLKQRISTDLAADDSFLSNYSDETLRNYLSTILTDTQIDIIPENQIKIYAGIFLTELDYTEMFSVLESAEQQSSKAVRVDNTNSVTSKFQEKVYTINESIMRVIIHSDKAIQYNDQPKIDLHAEKLERLLSLKESMQKLIDKS